MSFSVNTNASAFVALQNLTVTNKALTVTQNRINTGKAVATAKDNSAIFAIAQNLRSDLGGLNAVKQSIDRGLSTLDIAVSAAESISDLLVQMKEKAVAGADEGLDTQSRSALTEDFNALRDQIAIIVSNAQFNGSNLIDGNSGAGSRLKVLLSDAGTQTFSVANQSLGLGSSNVTIGATSTFTTATEAASMVTTIETSLTNVNKVLGTFGSGARTLDVQKSFVAKLADTIETGIGNLVDADLARESARLQSLQVKQQLGLQALSIANQSPQAVLSLFS
ncbi:MAG: flagellin [Pseudomonadota bacterium]